MWDKKEKNPGIVGPTESSGHGGSIAQSLVRSLTSQTSSQGWLSSSSSSSSLSSAIGRQSLVVGRRHHHHHQWWFTVIIIILMCLMMVMSLTFDIFWHPRKPLPKEEIEEPLEYDDDDEEAEYEDYEEWQTPEHSGGNCMATATTAQVIKQWGMFCVSSKWLVLAYLSVVCGLHCQCLIRARAKSAQK